MDGPDRGRARQQIGPGTGHILLTAGADGEPRVQRLAVPSAVDRDIRTAEWTRVPRAGEAVEQRRFARDRGADPGRVRDRPADGIAAQLVPEQAECADRVHDANIPGPE